MTTNGHVPPRLGGDPVELGDQYDEPMGKLPNLNVLGGCCGTDHRHVAAIANACHTH